MHPRRKFILNGALATTSLFLAQKKGWAAAQVQETTKKEGKNLKLGIAGYSFLHFNPDESLNMMKKMDVHYLPIKDFHLPLDSSQEEIAAFHAKLKEAGVEGYGVGPIYMKNKEEIDRAFDYAKKVGVDLIIGVPDPEDLPYVEEKCKQYNIRYGIHNHGPEDDVYPNATVVYNYVKGLDRRVGLCLDMGHDKRDGQDPIQDLKRYKDRIFDLHLKNVSKAANEGKTVELGRGVIDIPAFVKMLAKVGYTGACSLEFEKDMKDPIAGLSESVGYFKGVSACQGIDVL